MANNPKLGTGPKDEPRIAAGAATMVGANLTGNVEGAQNLERVMHNALKRAQDEGLDDAGQAAAVREAIERHRAGQPEE